MKTTLLFSTAVLLSIAALAQTTANNQGTVKSGSTVQKEKGKGKIEASGTASSSSAANSNAINSTSKTAASASENGKTVVASEKNHADATAKATNDQGEKLLAEKKEITAEPATGAELKTGEKDNKVTGNSSLTSDVSGGSASIENSGEQAQNEVATVVTNTATNTTAAVDAAAKQVKPAVVELHEQVKAISATKVAPASSVSALVKPVAPIKAAGNVKVNTAIKIQ